MHEVYLTSVSDTLLVGIPFIAILAFAIFRLDTLFASSKGASKQVNRRRSGCGMDENGLPLVVDPDGRPSETRPKRSTASF
jgi:hypothetical protein